MILRGGDSIVGDIVYYVNDVLAKGLFRQKGGILWGWSEQCLLIYRKGIIATAFHFRSYMKQ